MLRHRQQVCPLSCAHLGGYMKWKAGKEAQSARRMCYAPCSVSRMSLMFLGSRQERAAENIDIHRGHAYESRVPYRASRSEHHGV